MSRPRRPRKGHNSGGVAGELLRSFIERIERLKADAAEIAAEITSTFTEARGRGFDPKTMRRILAVRKLTTEQREEEDALLDIYMAALGMLGGTPLGDAALRRLDPTPPPAAPGDGDDDGALPLPDPDAQPAEADGDAATPEPPPPDLTAGKSIDDARAMGAAAARASRPLTDNPFLARDPRRAAFDEGWCMAAGTDGMDIPEAWRRSKKKKPEATP